MIGPGGCTDAEPDRSMSAVMPVAVPAAPAAAVTWRIGVGRRRVAIAIRSLVVWTAVMVRRGHHGDGAGDRRKGAERGGATVVAVADLGRKRARRRRAEAEGGERDRRRGSGGHRTGLSGEHGVPRE